MVETCCAVVYWCGFSMDEFISIIEGTFIVNMLVAGIKDWEETPVIETSGTIPPGIAAII